MKSRRASGTRGFAMLVVVMIVALVSVIALTLLNFLQMDLSIVGQNRRAAEARYLADAANMEIVDHLSTEEFLTTVVRTDPELTAEVPIVPDSWVARAGDETARPETYNARATFLRRITVSENTLTVVRGDVYEISATGVVNNGDASSEVRSEVIRLVTIDPNAILDLRQHGR